MSAIFFGGDVIHPVTLSNADAMSPQFSSPYFFMIVGPFYTTPQIIVHGIHIFPSQKSLTYSKMKFKGIEKRLGEVISPFHAEARTGYLNPKIDVREQ